MEYEEFKNYMLEQYPHIDNPETVYVYLLWLARKEQFDWKTKVTSLELDNIGATFPIIDNCQVLNPFEQSDMLFKYKEDYKEDLDSALYRSDDWNMLLGYIDYDSLLDNITMSDMLRRERINVYYMDTDFGTYMIIPF